MPSNCKRVTTNDAVNPLISLKSIPMNSDLNNIYQNNGRKGVFFSSNVASIEFYLNNNYFLKSLKISKQKLEANVIVFLYRHNYLIDSRTNLVNNTFTFDEFVIDVTDKITVLIDIIDENVTSVNNVKIIPTLCSADLSSYYFYL